MQSRVNKAFCIHLKGNDSDGEVRWAFPTCTSRLHDGPVTIYVHESIGLGSHSVVQKSAAPRVPSYGQWRTPVPFSLSSQRGGRRVSPM